MERNHADINGADAASLSAPQASDDLPHCPHCGVEVRPFANVCHQCHSFLDPRFDEQTFRLARFAVGEEVKEDLRRWFHQHAGVSIVVIALALFGGGKLIGLLATTQVQSEFVKRMEDVGRQIDASVAQTIATTIGNRVSTVDERLTDMEPFLAESRLHSDALYVNRRALDARLDAGLLGDTAGIIPLSPVHGEILFGEAPEITFSWRYPEPSVTSSIAFYDGDGDALETPLSTPSENAGFELTMRSEDGTASASFRTLFGRRKVRLSEICPAQSAAAVGRFTWTVEHLATGDASEPATFEVYRSVLDRIRCTGALRVGLSATPTEGFADEGEEGLAGREIEIVEIVADKVAAELRLPSIRVEYTMFEWIPLLEAPQRSDVDLIVSTITARESREEGYGIEFSTPYHISSQCVVVKAGSKTEKKLEEELASEDAEDDDLFLRLRTALRANNAHVATIRGSTGARAAEAIGLRPATGETVEEVLRWLETGTGPASNIVAAFIDTDIAAMRMDVRPDPMDEHPDSKLVALRLVEEGDDEGPEELIDPYAIAMRADQPGLLSIVNRAILEYLSR